MEKDDFYALTQSEKADIFSAIATEKGMTPFAVEKDWWVSRTLQIIFQMEIAAHLVFKGGTSLSKAWKLINRFSEDIDLAIDRAYWGYSGELNKNQRDKLRKEAGAYTTSFFFQELQKAFERNGFHGLRFKVIESTESDLDPRIIEIYYPYVIHPSSEYVLPKVQIEVSCRSLREPFSICKFGSLVDECLSDKTFARPLFEVPVVNPERTLLEKLFLLHEEFQRPTEKMRVNRLSRHLYDIHLLTKAGIAAIAIGNKELYETIVEHRFKFSRIGEVDYNQHHPHTLNPIPIEGKIAEWKSDYMRMKEEMIYEDNKPTFEDLIDNLKELRVQLQAVTWTFELSFPLPKSI